MLNSRPFLNALQKAAVIDLANPAGHRSKVGERVAQCKSHHRVVGRSGLEMPRQHAKALFAVKIVGIDDRKRLVNGARSHQDSVRRPPRFGPAERQGKTRQKAVELLKDVFHRDAIFKARADDSLERLLNLFADYEDKFAKARMEGVVDRVVHDGFST